MSALVWIACGGTPDAPDTALPDLGPADTAQLRDVKPPTDVQTPADTASRDGSARDAETDTEATTRPALQDPCRVAPGPGSSDAEVTACVCALDDYCCSVAWVQTCVDLAGTSCGLRCGCEVPGADLSCETDSDCDHCALGGDLCVNRWACVDAGCVDIGPVTCDAAADQGCLRNTCDPADGTCSLSPDWLVCDDADVCTADGCDASTGACTHEPIPGCGQNHPCDASGTPGTSDAQVEACVCAVDPFCCDDFGGWFSFCVDIAKASCGVSCDCASLTPAELPCVTDEDCAWCQTGDLCQGTWSCSGGACTTSGAVDCDPVNDVGCVQNLCDPTSGACAMQAATVVCEDGDPCTADVCEADGGCVNPVMCSATHPCQASEWPGTNDSTIAECVCGTDPVCCEFAWDEACTTVAESVCGAICDCEAPGADLTCETDADCAFCATDLCGAQWTCDAGTCVSGPGVTCDVSQDSGCVKNTCDPLTGGCEMKVHHTACADGLSCTVDLCDADDGTCANLPIDGCVGEPPFVCKGPGVASAEGCALVESYEGCCDPWGRVLWCDTLPDETGAPTQVTVCIDCAASAPFCGWNTFGYTCGTTGESGPLAFPKVCPGLP